MGGYKLKDVVPFGMDGDIGEILEDAPSNWGRWRDDDEIGAINYLTKDEVLRGIAVVESGKVFTLGVTVFSSHGDPVSPYRTQPQHFMKRDKGHYESGKVNRDGYRGLESSDDVMILPPQGTTHYDALGHIWYNDKLYNGYPSESTKGGLDKCSIAPIGEHGVVGRGILIDIARYRGVDRLNRGDRITLNELKECADYFDVEIHKRDIILIRTGWLKKFYEEGPESFIDDGMREPGLTYTDELADWFKRMEIPIFGTDTLGNEQTVSDTTGTKIPLHSLMRDQGVVFSEINKLDELSADSANDGKYDFLYMGSPLKISRATGSPVNPIVVK